jgi:hypothetical protein
VKGDRQFATVISQAAEGGSVKHLGLDVEPLEKRTLFSVSGAGVVPADEVIEVPGPHLTGQERASFSWLKVAERSTLQTAEFMKKAVDTGTPGFSKVSAAAADRAVDFFLKVRGIQD